MLLLKVAVWTFYWIIYSPYLYFPFLQAINQIRRQCPIKLSKSGKRSTKLFSVSYFSHAGRWFQANRYVSRCIAQRCNLNISLKNTLIFFHQAHEWTRIHCSTDICSPKIDCAYDKPAKHLWPLYRFRVVACYLPPWPICPPSSRHFITRVEIKQIGRHTDCGMYWYTVVEWLSNALTTDECGTSFETCLLSCLDHFNYTHKHSKYWTSITTAGIEAYH